MYGFEQPGRAGIRLPRFFDEVQKIAVKRNGRKAVPFPEGCVPGAGSGISRKYENLAGEVPHLSKRSSKRFYTNAKTWPLFPLKREKTSPHPSQVYADRTTGRAPAGLPRPRIFP
ncbi:MAG: hypothetical protein C6W56_07500 [Caldibacillus debilis]|nr:MAG: hypothetical protein C6W56_07500 [Caldibacillus debilis]